MAPLAPTDTFEPSRLTNDAGNFYRSVRGASIAAQLPGCPWGARAVAANRGRAGNPPLRIDPAGVAVARLPASEVSSRLLKGERGPRRQPGTPLDAHTTQNRGLFIRQGTRGLGSAKETPRKEPYDF